MTATKITNVTLMERRFSVRRFEETHSHTRDSCGKTKKKFFFSRLKYMKNSQYPNINLSYIFKASLNWIVSAWLQPQGSIFQNSRKTHCCCWYRQWRFIFQATKYDLLFSCIFWNQLSSIFWLKLFFFRLNLHKTKQSTQHRRMVGPT